ncbi:hypothetical protein [Cupriavidus basilensis]|uniref:hypothetical protein n=1 Tax=Cupriavidus basilensis TaxID=68895 RepID=UPI001ED8DF65|nr:hypothetical protein [Cupriavidus basilensis]
MYVIFATMRAGGQRKFEVNAPSSESAIEGIRCLLSGQGAEQPIDITVASSRPMWGKHVSH